jgi:hypothetical protein
VIVGIRETMDASILIRTQRRGRAYGGLRRRRLETTGLFRRVTTGSWRWGVVWYRRRRDRGVGNPPEPGGTWGGEDISDQCVDVLGAPTFPEWRPTLADLLGG